MTPGYREFEFDLPEALLSRLIVAFDEMEGAPLLTENLKGLPDAQGVYQLIVDDVIVYIGKTDSEAGLRRRLDRHAWTIQHRRNLKSESVKFKALRVFVFTAIDLESQLISHYKKSGHVTWNNSGFGSNDPGRNRDFTRLKPTHFDVLFPIDLDRTVELNLNGEKSVADILQAINAEIPYRIRYELNENDKKPHKELISTTLKMKPERITTRKIIARLVKALPRGWQATQLAGRVILYKESESKYPGEIIAQS